MSMLALRRTAKQCVAPAAVPARSALHARRLQRPCRAGTDDQPESSSNAAANSSIEQSEVSTSSSSSSFSTFPYGVMAGLAAAGAAETTYLTLSKVLNASVACPTSGCDSVLNSAYAQLFGLPLPLFGAAAYAAVAAAAAMAQQAAGAGRPVPSWLSTGLAAGVAVLATSSAYLMYILHSQLGGASCVWCYASAAISAALLSSLIAGMDNRQMADAAGPGLGATAAAALALYLGFGAVPGQGASNAAELELPYVSPAVTTQSSDETVSLARRLREAGAVMYGAFWCSHCYDQKQEFGQQAMAEFPYVECFPEGWKRGVKIADACEAASVKAFPTWVINGQVTEGQLELQQLEQLLNEATAAAQPAASESAALAAASQ